MRKHENLHLLKFGHDFILLLLLWTERPLTSWNHTRLGLFGYNLTLDIRKHYTGHRTAYNSSWARRWLQILGESILHQTELLFYLKTRKTDVINNNSIKKILFLLGFLILNIYELIWIMFGPVKSHSGVWSNSLLGNEVGPLEMQNILIVINH